jgi:hypothetical protein
MLPQIFRTDDVLLEIEFPINDRLPLEKLLANLPTETFTADDSLGWVYQFWQSKKKDEVNRSGAKIDGRTLPAVTQLFTEPYMVKFLLHNTIGAWWCTQHEIKGPPDEAGSPGGQAPVEMDYLRWRDDGTPAAGTFDGWPNTLKEFTMLDPCCGSGHFLVEAFHLLVQLRMHDEGLAAREACDVVLTENLFGLELDPRCTQIAAFALALTAWKYPDESGQPLGYRPLPTLNIACSGQSVTGRKEEWLTLANGDEKLKNGMNKPYDLFRQAPHLGSLIDPQREAADLISAGFAELHPLLERVFAKEKVQQDADAVAVGVAAQGIAKAVELLAKEYTLIATNVPYLKRGSQHEILQGYCETHFGDAKGNLATTFVRRWLSNAISTAVVVLQSWLYQPTYLDFRHRLLMRFCWRLLARLGPGAFEMISGEVVNVCLFISDHLIGDNENSFVIIDVTAGRSASLKAKKLKIGDLEDASQKDQLKKPGYIISSLSSNVKLLEEYADSVQGIKTGDDPRFRRCFWEIQNLGNQWRYYQSTVERVCIYGGLENVLYWGDKGKDITRLQGLSAWGRFGAAVSQMSELPCAIYLGEAFDSNMSAIVPRNEEHALAVFAFCSSEEYRTAVRTIDDSMKPTNSNLTKVPFDLQQWLSVAEEMGPLPEPLSNNPTQWLFKGDIASSTDSLHVAIARMLGYRWPEQPKEEDAIDALADKDGIVCIQAVRSERPAAERLLDILRMTHSSRWSDAILHKLLTDAGSRPGMSLNDWLRDKFFELHCKRFHHHPFIWHIWDGRKDSFSCLVNYHKLNHQRLETLTYAYLQDWITAQTAGARDGKPGSELRFAASQELQNKLKLILEGEPPYDIFVRWKPMHEQPIGWNPDLNDGVCVNIRPFVVANVLRKPPNIKWTKDRGKEPERDPEQFPWFWKNGAFTGDRINDVHLTKAQKRAARERVNRGTGG